MPGSSVGFTAGDTIWLDRDAAGYELVIDPTPGDDVEFGPGGRAGAAGPAAGRVDVLTVLTHEVGHLFGLPTTTRDDLMGDNLPLGVRRIALDRPMDFEPIDVESAPD